ncbi:SDR family oxidoreductase [Nocardia sp. NPDC051756]|uniref:SDR family NAD(P)-dependent oxidoreductase n=1 Tax=Nocardia sp. NPDC051756 TaxID=3154751 RepID=UPI00341BDDB5
MKTAVVTGAASGIGMGYALALVEQGYHVLVTDIDMVGAERVTAELNGIGPGTAEARYLDVADADAVATLVQQVKNEHGRLDMIFNNAGLAIGGPVHDLTLAHWQRAADVNVMGVVHGVDAAYKIMVEQGYGHIVNTASIAGLVPAAFMGPYNMSKHAVVGLTLSLRGEAAAHGVKVVCVCPIAVHTDLPRRLNDGLEKLPETEIAASLYDRFDSLFRALPEFVIASPEGHGRKVLRAVERNRAFVIEPWFGRPVWWLQRLFPTLPVTLSVAATLAWKAAQPYLDRVAQRLTRTDPPALAPTALGTAQPAGSPQTFPTEPADSSVSVE